MPSLPFGLSFSDIWEGGKFALQYGWILAVVAVALIFFPGVFKALVQLLTETRAGRIAAIILMGAVIAFLTWLVTYRTGHAAGRAMKASDIELIIRQLQVQQSKLKTAPPVAKTPWPSKKK